MLKINLGNVNIEICDQELETLNFYGNTSVREESGGIILGGYIPSDSKYIVTQVTEPCKNDRKFPSCFIRSKNDAQKIIDNSWQQSKGQINYLGEWHTHRCVWPYPSSTDRKLLKMIIDDKSNVWPQFFMLIAGWDNTMYIGMTDVDSNGKIISEKQIRR